MTGIPIREADVPPGTFYVLPPQPPEHASPYDKVKWVASIVRVENVK